MQNKPYDDSNWRKELKESKLLTKFQIEILENGPRSLSQSWILGAMYGDWKKLKGIKEPEPPDCQSSFKEWENSIKKYDNDDEFTPENDPYGGY